MDFEIYVRGHYPQIGDEYDAYLRKDTLPKIGSKVRTRTSGYGSYEPRDLKVTGYGYKDQPSSDGAIWGNDYIILGGAYVVPMKNWWKEITIIKEA